MPQKDKLALCEAQLAAATTTRQKIDALNALAWELRSSLNNRGPEYATTAHELAQAEAYPQGIAESLINQCQFIFSDFARALALASQALTIFEREGDRVGQYRAFYTLCWAYWFADDFVQSIEMGQRGLVLARETGDHVVQAEILNNLGLAYKRAGNYELAYTVYAESLSLFRALGDRAQEGKILANIALAYAEHGQYDRALLYARECEQLQLDDPKFNGYVFFVLGQVYAGKKEFELALYYLRQAMQFVREHPEQKQLAQVTLQMMGRVHLERRECDLAITYLAQGLGIAQEIQSNLYVYRFHELLSQVYETQGDLAQALFHHKQFHTIKETVFNDSNTRRRQALETQHQTEIARREAEIYHLRNIELEREIAERKRLEAELREQAITDELTGVHNRRYFLELAQVELDRAFRLHHPFAIVLVDLDYFKQINDTYGHATGDLVLKTFTQICRNHIRAIDVFARFGGDEFALFLPGTDCATASQVIERVRAVLLANPIQVDDTSVLLSLSAGVACLNAQRESFDQLLSRADHALYRAKQAGRNCIMVESAS